MNANASTFRNFNWWNIGLWLTQALLALVFFTAGIAKVTQSREELVERGWSWAADLSGPFIVFLGVMELLAVIGIILQAATRILPILTPIAAAGMAVTQVSAIVMNDGGSATNFIWLAMAVIVVWGRTRKAPIAGRPGFPGGQAQGV